MVFECECLICDYNEEGSCTCENVWINDSGECESRRDNPLKEAEENAE